MKKSLIWFMVGAAMLLTIASCKKDSVPDRYVPQKGEDVIFNLKDGGSSIGTKASYAGKTGSGVEYISWEQGDMVRIYCAECSDPTLETYGYRDHWADYVAGIRNEENTGSQIKVQDGTVGLRWGDPGTSHTFYGMFPSPTLTGKTTDSFCENSTTVLKGTIRQEQGFQSDFVTTTPETGKTMVEALPDMTDMYMVGKTSITPSSDLSEKKVLLGYTPVTTAIQFTIAKGTELVEDVQWVAIESASHTLYGVFSTDLSAAWTTPEGYTGTYPTCSLVGTKPSGASRLKIDFTGKNVQIGKDKALRFTFLLLPVSGSENIVDDITFYINKGTDGKYGTLKTEIKRTDGATAEANKIPFPTHKKNYITGMIVPDRVTWNVSFSPVVNPWEEVAGGGSDSDRSYNQTFTTPAIDGWEDEPSGDIIL